MENTDKNNLTNNKDALSFQIIAVTPVGEGLSGGDRIFIQLAKSFSRDHTVHIITWEDGIKMCKREHLLPSANLTFTVLRLQKWQKSNFALCYIIRIIKAIYFAFTTPLSSIKNDPSTILYSASDFWMDSIPGFILKKRFPEITWVGSYYLAAPNPFLGFKENGKLKVPSFKDSIYWAMQQAISYMLKSAADIIFVTSQPDLKRFPKHKNNARFYVVKGGVDLEQIEQWKKTLNNTEKLYDGVFMGRFHPQKGVLELIDIWSKVVEKKPSAKLVMIGDGPLMQKIKEKIATKGLTENIVVPGYVLDGEKKYRYFAESRIFLHTSVYDSGGMSAAEAMAWKIPAVSFALEALKTYYPKGMLKIKIGDLDLFAKTILDLLTDKKLYEKTSADALDLIEEQWSWQQRSENILQFLYTYVSKNFGHNSHI